jgi:hypothetical protein
MQSIGFVGFGDNFGDPKVPCFGSGCRGVRRAGEALGRAPIPDAWPMVAET